MFQRGTMEKMHCTISPGIARVPRDEIGTSIEDETLTTRTGVSTLPIAWPNYVTVRQLHGCSIECDTWSEPERQDKLISDSRNG
jgi:hypothetical protein